MRGFLFWQTQVHLDDLAISDLNICLFRLVQVDRDPVQKAFSSQDLADSGFSRLLACNPNGRFFEDRGAALARDCGELAALHM